MGNLSNIIGLRIYNKTRSCILMKQFASGTWTIPMTTLPNYFTNALTYVNHALSQVKVEEDFKMLSAISIIDYTLEDKNENSFRSIIYDVSYTGKIDSGLIGKDDIYVKSQWMPPISMQKCDRVTFPTKSLIIGMKAESCLM